MDTPGVNGIVIVGAGLAGTTAASTLREESFDGPITLISAETSHPYDHPPLSKGYLLGSETRESTFLHPEQWYAENGIDLRLGCEVTAIDRAAKSVTLHDGATVAYDRLLLATGSRVVTLDLPGANLTGVRYLRTLEESDALVAGFGADRRVVVVGAGWIGLEAAAAARTHGATVTVVEQDRLPLRRVLGDETAAVFADLHTAHGVEFAYGATVSEFVGEDDAVTGVKLGDGTVLPADVVVVGVGIRPNVELAEAAGLAVEDGVVTDRHLRTEDENVYAVGDVASSYRPCLDRRVRVEHWQNAASGGEAAARAILGTDGDGYDQVPYFFTDQYDLGMEYTGFVDPDAGYDEIVFRGDVANREFIAFWVRDSRVLAGMNVNVWDVAGDIEALVRSGRQVDRERLADTSVAIAEV